MTAGYTLDLAKYIASKSKKPGATYTTVPDMIPVPDSKYWYLVPGSQHIIDPNATRDCKFRYP